MPQAEYRTCVVCDDEIPLSRGKSITCSKDCAAINAMDNPSDYGASVAKERRLYDYSETEYQRAIKRLGLSQLGAAKLLGINARTSRRYSGRDLSVPLALQMLLRLAVHLEFDASEFDSTVEPIVVLIRAIYRRNLKEDKFFELIDTPIR